MRAFASLSTNYPDLRLLLVGEGSYRHELEKMSESLNLQEKVVFAGRIPFEKISDYYNMLDIFVNISEYESFGVSVIEALACGIPVVVTDVGGLKEIVKDASIGL